MASSDSTFVKLHSLKPWSLTHSPSPDTNNTNNTNNTNDTNANANNNDSSEASEFKNPSLFPFNLALNQKIYLWQGDICDLEVDAIVNTTNERLNDRNGISGIIHARVGPDLALECAKIQDGCHTGEAVITKSFNIPASYVIHTVGPRFSIKYQTAAENALHSCYRRSMELLKENQLETIAFPPINTEKKGYPKDNAAHIAIRTIRRCLERFGNSTKSVVFCFNTPDEYLIYEKTLPLYFPRDAAEEVAARSLLPADTGNEFGESVIAERQIRISAMPGMSGDDQNEGPSSSANPNSNSNSSSNFNPNVPIRAAKSVYQNPLDDDTVDSKVYTNDFVTAQENPDEVRRKLELTKSKKQLEEEEAERLYSVYLRRSREEDLSDVARHNFIYQSGVDSMGRPVVVLIANQIPATMVDLERILLYIIKLLDALVEKEYTVVYFHTNIQSENKPPLNWLKQVYQIFNRKYKKNMKSLYIIHPSFWAKVVLSFTSLFVSKKFWKKVKMTEKLIDIYQDINPQSIRIPPEIIKYDQELNAKEYGAVVARPPDANQQQADASSSAQL